MMVVVGDLLTEGERSWLMTGLRDLVARHGPQPLLTAPILTATPRDFPDPFTPDEHGVRTLLLRILRYAGLDGVGAEVDTFSQPDEVREIDERGEAKAWGHKGAAAWFAGIDDDGVCHFGVAEEHIGDPENLVATLCHEVAHAWRALHHERVDDRAVEERLTDLTTVFLGFGLLTTNGAYRYRSGSRLEGTRTYTEWSHSRGGYLPPEAMSFLLAAQVKARGLGWLARRRLAAQLETNQASYFRWALRRLGTTSDVHGALGIARTLTATAA